MSFVSAPFLIFVAFLLLLYFIVPPKVRWIVLLAGSYFYYAASAGMLILFIIFTTLTVYACTMLLSALNREQSCQLENRDAEWLRQHKKDVAKRYMRYKRWVLLAGLLLNFGVLAFLKYYDFLAENINGLFSVFSLRASLPSFSLLLPLGISFYTFQVLGYVIDVYRDKVPAERNFFRLALFVSFFPQIVQGPISRYDQLAHQLYEPHRFEYDRFKRGMLLILWGFFKKLVIADRAAILVSAVLPHYKDYAGIEIGFAVLMFMVQVYGDFSGGMDIARGISQCIGIDMVQNFERPHFAVGIGDYWRRWHITLGSWMRDYLLYPLSLSRGFGKLGKKTRKWFGKEYGKIIPTCLAMTVVFLTVGIWHGAEWRHVMFGVYNGFFIVLGILLAKPIQKIQEKHPWFTSKILVFRILLSLGTCFIIFISKYFAAADNVGHALKLLISTFSVFNPDALWDGYFENTGFGLKNLCIIAASIAVFFAVSLMQENGIQVRDFLSRRNIIVRWVVYFILLFSVLLLSANIGEGGNAFVYAQF